MNGINIDFICEEMKSLAKNNYDEFNKEVLRRNVDFAIDDLIARFSVLLVENRGDIIHELEKELE